MSIISENSINSKISINSNLDDNYFKYDEEIIIKKIVSEKQLQALIKNRELAAEANKKRTKTKDSLIIKKKKQELYNIYQLKLKKKQNQELIKLENIINELSSEEEIIKIKPHKKPQKQIIIESYSNTYTEDEEIYIKKSSIQYPQPHLKQIHYL